VINFVLFLAKIAVVSFLLIRKMIFTLKHQIMLYAPNANVLLNGVRGVIANEQIYSADNAKEIYLSKSAGEQLDRVPTADVQEIKHGKWVQCKKMRREGGEIYDYNCSRCCGLAGKDNYGNHAISAYCPHCGAKMDGDESE